MFGRFVLFSYCVSYGFRVDKSTISTKFSAQFIAAVLVAMLSFLSPLAMAAQDDLYRIQTTTQGRDSESLKRATKDGLDQVLQRFTTLDAISRSAKARFLAQPTRMLDRYDFKDNAGKGYTANLVFLPGPIKTIIRESSAPYLPEKRPDILAWIVIDDPLEGKSLITRNGHPLAKGLAKWESALGLSIKYPVYDLKDRNEASLEDIWAFDERSIFSASSRYRSNVLLLGRVNRTADGRYMATWQHIIANRSGASIDTRAKRPSSLSEKPMRSLSAALIRQLGLSNNSASLQNADTQQSINSASSQPNLTLAAVGINDFSRFQKALSYLESLSIINQVGVQSIDERGIVFKFGSSVSADRIRERLLIDREFAEAQTPSAFSIKMSESNSSPDALNLDDKDSETARSLAPNSYTFILRLRN